VNPVIVKNGRHQTDSSVKLEFCVAKTKGEEKNESVRVKRAWNDQDMSWLKRFSPSRTYQSENRRWIGQRYPLPHFRMGKRLWEGAEDEVGWMKRDQEGMSLMESVRLAVERLCYYARLVGKDCKELLQTSNLQNDLDEVPEENQVQRNISDAQLSFRSPDDNKRKWKESDISWL